MVSSPTLDLFGDAPAGAGSLACGIEIAATMTEALDQARRAGTSRESIAQRMSYALGNVVSLPMLNAYTAGSRDSHEISLRRAMAFDAAIHGVTGRDPLLSLHAAKRGRQAVSPAEAAYIELGRIHQQESDLAERKRALKVMLKHGAGR